MQGSQLPAGIEFAGRYLIQQDRRRTGSSATVLAHDTAHQDSAEEGPAEVIGPALPCPAFYYPALPCPSLPFPLLPCPALPCPALP